MHHIAILGEDPVAHAAVRACELAGMASVTRYANASGGAHSYRPTAFTLSANLTRITQALGFGDTMAERAHAPDREQVRLARSGYLVSELPLGTFTSERYGAPHLNIEGEALTAVLNPAQEKAPSSLSLKDAEANHDAVLVCTPPDADPGAPTHFVWHAAAETEQPARANVTWLAPRMQAQQFSTRTHDHLLVLTSSPEAPSPDDWHPALHGALERAIANGSQAWAGGSSLREFWHEGTTAYLGDACRSAPPWLRETRLLGFEDAWVVSRMLENYEEDLHDGLASYAQFRRPRTAKVARLEAEVGARLARTDKFRRLLGHIGAAASARFLPEIAMQRIDWLYQYDCIRGFR